MEILKISKESLENSIKGLSQLKPVLQRQCLVANLDGQCKQDSKELGEHFETAINSMVTVLGLMETAQEVPVQEQHKFVPEDSDGICKGEICERNC